MNYTLPSVAYVNLKFTLEAVQTARLPAFKGSMLRGALGHALKRTVCVMKHSDECQNCLLRQQCGYTRLFETFIEQEPPPFLKGIQTAPRPFIIHTWQTKAQYQKGECFEFEMTLIGKACDNYPYVIFAFDQAARAGFTGNNHPFRLKQVSWFDGEWKLLYNGSQLVDRIVYQYPDSDVAFESSQTLQFTTPTRFMINGKLTADFDFRTLVFKMLRRTLEMVHFHVDNADVNWEFKDYLDFANQVEINEKQFQWEDWKRYSSRQKSVLELGGFIGSMQLKGDLAPFGPLLKTSEVLHVGKGTVFGLGKVRVG